MLIYWGQVTHIYVSKLTIIGSDNGLSPVLCQAIIETKAIILLFEPLEINFSEMLIKIHTLSFPKMYHKMFILSQPQFITSFRPSDTYMHQ